MLHPTDIAAEDDEFSTPLSKDDVTKHFPPDFDCGQLLFSNEKFLWVQHVPFYKRYVFRHLVLSVIRNLVVLTLAAALVYVGLLFEDNSGNEARDEYAHTVKIDYLIASGLFFLLDMFLLYSEYGGYGIDIATNIRVFHAVIYPTVVYCETISYKSIELVTRGSDFLLFEVRDLKKDQGIIDSIKAFFGLKFALSYVPEHNSWIKSNIDSLLNNSSREAAELARTEDALLRLENSTPCRTTDIPQIYSRLSDTHGAEDELLWGYRPSPFEKKRAMAIQVGGMVIYFAVATGGLVVPALRVAATYSLNFVYFIVGAWVFYFIAIMIMTTEFDEMVALSRRDIGSFTMRLTCFGKMPQCGKKVSKLSYRGAYPLYSYLYRTPNSTPAEYKSLRKLQGLVARFFVYTDGSGAIQFPNNLLLRLPNVHDVEHAILQKHYESDNDAATGPAIISDTSQVRAELVRRAETDNAQV